MKKYRLETTRAVELEVEAAFEWYEREQTGLGFEFLGESRAAYRRIIGNPLAYQILRSGIRARIDSPISIGDLLLDRSRSACYSGRSSHGPRSRGVAAKDLAPTTKLRFAALVTRASVKVFAPRPLFSTP